MTSFGHATLLGFVLIACVNSKVMEFGKTIPSEVKSRMRRSAFGPISKDDATIALNSHNDYRSKEGAANMEYMSWDSILAQMAQNWAEACDFAHGMPKWPSGTVERYKSLGQNLYMNTGGSFTYADVIFKWHAETQHYTLETNGCTGVCGHYTQVVWYSSKLVGCGAAFCSTLTDSEKPGTSYKNAVHVVCQYAPQGNLYGGRPYVKGAACSKCSSGHFWCDNNMCRDCPKENMTCPCKPQCKNGGVPKASDCSCECAAGWTGVDCSDVCQDTHPSCGKNPGYPKQACGHWPVPDRCPALCEKCKAAPPTVAPPSTKASPTTEPGKITTTAADNSKIITTSPVSRSTATSCGFKYCLLCFLLVMCSFIKKM